MPKIEQGEALGPPEQGFSTASRRRNVPETNTTADEFAETVPCGGGRLNPGDKSPEKDRVEVAAEDAYHCSECGYTACGRLAYVDVRAHIVNVHLRKGTG